MKEGGILAGKYVLERELARGGMGSVWRAKHAQLGTPLAVKFMDGALAAMPELRTRFEREARAAAVLQIPNVVRVVDYGLDGDVPYIAMELLTGETLSLRLKRERRLSLPAAAKVISQVAKALRRAHEAGIIHRDLKPQNIFLAKVDDEEVVKVLDFGVAKMLLGEGAASETSTGMLLGSPSYMSPEQVRKSRTVDHRSDLWSLGVVAYRALTGRLPFPGDEIGDVIVRICTEPVPRASSIDPGLGLEVDEFFARALAREPEARFQSASELAAEFGKLAGRQSIAAPPGVEALESTTGPSYRPLSEGISNTPAAQALSVADAGDEGTLAHATAGSDVRAVRSTNRAGLAVLAACVATIAGVSGIIWAVMPSHGSAHDAASASEASAQPLSPPPSEVATAAPQPSAPPEAVAAPPASSVAAANAVATTTASSAKPSASPKKDVVAKPASAPAARPATQPQPPLQQQTKKPSSVLGF
jgi:serine/threonine protein kinase